ncbi:protein KAKU4-like isoform X2 [Apium graveolens]|uniref:protein KAKU4-like isoform X2 n=1 Tax=Apium graveolens TaxID=4045 RepID=UPI003D7B332E
MNTTPRAQTTVAGVKSGDKIVKRRRYAARTPYKRRRPRRSPKNTGTKRLIGDILSNSCRIIAKGAMKFLTFMTDTDYVSSSESDEDDVSCDDKVYAPSEINKWKEKDITLTEMIRICPKWVIAKLLPQETFSREESDKLIKIINSRVVDRIPMGDREDAGLMETPSRRSGTHDRCSKAAMQEKHCLQHKIVESSSKTNMDHGHSAFGSVPLLHSADMARSYMQACPPWASSNLRPSGLRTPSPSQIAFTIGGSSFPCAQNRGTLSARSWNIQDEVRKVRSKAAEDMMHALPSKKNDLLVVSEHKTFHNSIVPGGNRTVDRMHLSKSEPEKEHVGPSTFHDSKDSFALSLKQDGMQAELLSSNPSASVSEPDQHLIVEGATATDSHHSMYLVKQQNESDTNSKDGTSRRYDLRIIGAPDANSLASLRSSLRSRLSAGIEQNPKQSSSRRNR